MDFFLFPLPKDLLKKPLCSIKSSLVRQRKKNKHVILGKLFLKYHYSLSSFLSLHFFSMLSPSLFFLFISPFLFLSLFSLSLYHLLPLALSFYLIPFSMIWNILYLWFSIFGNFILRSSLCSLNSGVHYSNDQSLYLWLNSEFLHRI